MLVVSDSCLFRASGSLVVIFACASFFGLSGGSAGRDVLEIVPDEIVIERAAASFQHSLGVLVWWPALATTVRVALVLGPGIPSLDKHVRPEIILRTAAFAGETHLTIPFERQLLFLLLAKDA